MPLPRASSAPCRKVSLEPLVPPVGKDISPLQHCGLFCGRPYSDLSPQGLQGHLWSPASTNLRGMEKGDCNKPVHRAHTCSAQVDPNQRICSSTKPCWWHTLNQGIQQGADLPELDSHIRSFAGPRGWFSHALGKELNHTSRCCGEWLQVTSD